MVNILKKIVDLKKFLTPQKLPNSQNLPFLCLFRDFFRNLAVERICFWSLCDPKKLFVTLKEENRRIYFYQICHASSHSVTVCNSRLRFSICQFMYEVMGSILSQ